MHENTFIDKIDNWLLTKSQNERGLIYIISFLAIVGIIYLAIFQSSEDFLSSNKNQLTQTTRNLATKVAYINENKPSIPVKKQEIEDYLTLLVNVNEANNYIDSRLKELSYLLFNDQSWANFMDRLALLAKEYKINISKIENTFLDSKDLQSREVKQVLNIEVDSRGSFHNIIKFLNAIEESQLVVDVYNSMISSTSRSNSVDSNIKIAVWGMLY
jgi:hypothetical protein